MTINSYSMKLYAAIGVGGMIGAVCRYSISIVIEDGNGFPFATLTANLIGCFLLTFLLNYEKIKTRLSPEVFSALTIGMIGAFTTFSTVTVEVVNLWSLNILMAMAYILISVFGGLVFCYSGYKLAARRRVNL